MGFTLSPPAAAEGYRLETPGEVGSTNALALARAAGGDPGLLWVVSDNQVSGRGRRGRAWVAPPGNLAATLLLVCDFGPQRAATLGFVAGLALADALDAVAPALDVRLKWPNDVLADRAKLSGILLESTPLGAGRLGLAVGIGVNVVSSPDDTPYPAASLAGLGAACDAQRLFLALSDAWPDNFALWAQGRGLARVRERWLARAAGLGEEVAVRVDGSVLRGVFETIDDECRFILRRENGDAVAIAAGDVHFGTVASAGS